MRRAGVLRISREMLAVMLRLREGHAVAAVLPPDRMSTVNGYVEVLIEGPTMPAHHEGMAVAWLGEGERVAMRPSYCEGE